MKALGLIAVGSVLLLACSHRDQIDRITTEESRNPYFGNGMFPIIPLPVSATSTQVVSEVLRNTNFTILKVRQVRICYDEETAKLSDPNYTALLLDSISGRKVILLKYHRGKGRLADFWWSRIYETN
jgi:hypothetical protein